MNSTGYCHISVTLQDEMHVLPGDKQSKNLTKSIYEPHKSYVRSRTGNKALCLPHGLSWVCQSASLLQYVSMHFLPQFMSCKHTHCSESTPQSSGSSSLYTSTFLILPLDAASCLVTMAGTKSCGGGCFFGEGEQIVPHFLAQRSGDNWEPAGTSKWEEQHPHRTSKVRRFPAGR